ncbi:MAG: hypothetical protein LBR28_03500 [Bacteroidales bacterium]|nr:hypothetical protein [Bacteroidales bacterium]
MKTRISVWIALLSLAMTRVEKIETWMEKSETTVEKTETKASPKSHTIRRNFVLLFTAMCVCYVNFRKI